MSATVDRLGVIFCVFVPGSEHTYNRLPSVGQQIVYKGGGLNLTSCKKKIVDSNAFQNVNFFIKFCCDNFS